MVHEINKPEDMDRLTMGYVFASGKSRTVTIHAGGYFKLTASGVLEAEALRGEPQAFKVAGVRVDNHVKRWLCEGPVQVKIEEW